MIDSIGGGFGLEFLLNAAEKAAKRVAGVKAVAEDIQVGIEVAFPLFAAHYLKYHPGPKY